MEDERIAKLESRIEAVEIDLAYEVLRGNAEHLATLSLLQSLSESSGLVSDWRKRSNQNLRDALMEMEGENPTLAVRVQQRHPGLWEEFP